LHNSKKNINFARFLSGKQVNVFGKILKIGHFVKSDLQNRQTVKPSQRHDKKINKQSNLRLRKI